MRRRFPFRFDSPDADVIEVRAEIVTLVRLLGMVIEAVIRTRCETDLDHVLLAPLTASLTGARLAATRCGQ